MVAMSRRKPQRGSWNLGGGILLVGLLLVVIVVQAGRLLWRLSSTVLPPPPSNGMIPQALKESKLTPAKPLRIQKQQPEAVPKPPPPPVVQKKVESAKDDDDTEDEDGSAENEKDDSVEKQNSEEDEEKEGDDTEKEENESVDTDDNEKKDQGEAELDPDGGLTVNNNNNNNLDESTKLVLQKHGTGPTKMGYVADYAYERAHPSFRLLPQQWKNETYKKELAQTVAKQLSVSAVQSCEAEESDEDSRLILYNGAPFDRHVCGLVWKPFQAQWLPDDCHYTTTTTTKPSTSQPPPLHLLPQDIPPLKGHGMPPIVVLLNNNKQKQNDPDTTTSETKEVECDIPCHWHTEAWTQTQPHQSPPAALRIQGTGYTMTWTDADPASEKKAQIERTSFRNNHYYATTSWQSDVPLQSFDFQKYDYHNAPGVDFDSAQPAVASVLNHDCTSGTPIRRQKWMESLTATLPKEQVKFYGACQHNADLPHDIPSLDTLENRVALLKRHRIAIAYETSTEKWHVTDTVWEALLSGAVPAILGASNLEPDILPPHSALLASQYSSWDDFSLLVQSVLHNKTLWQSYQTWRTNATLLRQFEQRLNFTRTSAHCRTCRWAYAKQYGLGWNAAQQTVQEPVLPRDTLCLSDQTHLVTKPFRESWHDAATHSAVDDHNHHHDEDDESVSCRDMFVHSSFPDLGMERTVWHHDGVTDLTVHVTSETPVFLTLRFQVPIRNQDEGAIFRHVHTLVPNLLRTSVVSSVALQDERSKFTVVGNFVAHDMSSPSEGVLELVIPTPHDDDQKKTISLRVITEDVNPIHDKLTEYDASSYAQIVLKDFIDPMDVFRVVA